MLIRPAVSIGGSTSSVVANGLSATAALALPESLLAYPAPGTDVFDFSVSATTPTGGYVDESGLLASPDVRAFEHDHLAGDDASAFFDSFDISDYLNDDDINNINSTGERQQQQHGFNDRAVTGLSLHHLETQDSSADPFQQPPSGASLTGCDVEGIAVGGL